MSENLRGRYVRFAHPITGKDIDGRVVTRTRGTRWQIVAAGLPESHRRYDGTRRIVLDRGDFALVDPPAPVRRGRSPIERLIDKACGL